MFMANVPAADGCGTPKSRGVSPERTKAVYFATSNSPRGGRPGRSWPPIASVNCIPRKRKHSSLVASRIGSRAAFCSCSSFCCCSAVSAGESVAYSAVA